MICSKCGTMCAQGTNCTNCGAALAYGATYTPQPYQQPTAPNQIAGPDPRYDYTPLGAWAYFGYNLLFAIPLVGLILIFVFALGGTKNINLRNYSRSFFCSLVISAIFLIIFWGTIVSFIDLWIW